MMLRVSHLRAAYDGIEALRGVDLSIDEGEMVALIGPNGAGKSTLLNCLSGVIRNRKGSIIFAGREIGRMAPYAIARAGLLQAPEGRQILGDMTVLENLQVGTLALGGRSSPYDLDKVFQLFPVLRERENLPARTLSGGQQQMLAIGRALMGGPRMLLLDEPSLGLSPLITDQVFSVLGALNRDGLTILLVEQNAHRALGATTRAYILEQGRVAMESDSESLVRDPKVIEHYLG
ncbi:ABC transporter ATP-binding protein [Terrarubrum flagellatum]|uniref:ABC transporter ATP-binding protein n=1 Tax=Terrirubrum flagellatum TaxID=2895980 RepID=UPI0031455798